MFATAKRLRIESMTVSHSSNATVNPTDVHRIQFTSPTIIDENDLWEDIKAFFNPQNSMIILAIICLIFFLITLCLVFIILQLLKKKRFYQNQSKPTMTNYPKLAHHLNFPASPIQMGLTSNQIASLGNILPTNKEIKIPESPVKAIVSTSGLESNQTQSFDNFESELKRTWNEKGLTSSINDDEIETVNEVLGMEERNGKVYYRVNFTGHPSDYTAWVCEEDLIPE